MTTPTIDREIERRLAEAEVRYTKGRRMVIDALAEADGPRSAAELSETIGDTVPLSSLYRSLAVLEEAVRPARGGARPLWLEARELYATVGIDAGVQECDEALARLGTSEP